MKMLLSINSGHIVLSIKHGRMVLRIMKLSSAEDTHGAKYQAKTLHARYQVETHIVVSNKSGKHGGKYIKTRQD